MKYTYLIILLFCFFSSKTQAQPKNEIRATWLTTIYGLDWPTAKATSPASINRQKAELCKILDELKAANFNTVLLQTRLRGDVIYPSSIETYNETMTGKEGCSPGYDALAFAIEECHKRGMECHAWIVAIPLGKEKHVNNLGKNSITRKQPQICKRYQGEWFLDPGNPGTKEYLLSLVKEVVTRYDVDGINLDYIRYPDQPKDFPDKNTYIKYGNGKTLDNWRRDNITTIVRYLYKQVKQIKPWVKMSSSPVGKFKDTSHYPSGGWNAYHTVYQDAQGWLKEGIQDILFPMMYFNGNNFYPFALDWQEKSFGRCIVPGLGIYFLDPAEKDWPLSEIERQIYFTRRHGLMGQAFYRTKYLLNNTKNLFDELNGFHYAYPALQPKMKWMDDVPPTLPQGLTYNLEGSAVQLNWQTSTDNDSRTAPYYNIYASDHFPVDISKPYNIVAHDVRENHYAYKEEPGSETKRYFAVTATDRFGNESAATQLAPAKNIFQTSEDSTQLLLPPSQEFVNITITDISGRCVLYSKYEERISISHLQKGLYRIIFTDNSGKIHPSTKMLAR
ncbi:family 10 glycosylhydrolase [uncultured Bacteroides sp.]|uniref:family 10 glycosylhydrolase n=1 Tax=uncultured Bacteroides sp. TaxID=162156 RepID=UPI002AABE569|nr:family 10 glycosylhydrolase [uncultured Bacteroides sp.]